ncbi:MAG: hypothetical protein GX575_05505 [Candidatus Anammoximicrobium sp.]|nr:hypothetical protein [Candidatus Anammoximicrobium sp.]
MPRETILVLDLEGTLISNAVSQFPRSGLYAFLDFCRGCFDRIYLYTAVRQAIGEAIVRTLVAENSMPEWFLDVPFVRWNTIARISATSRMHGRGTASSSMTTAIMSWMTNCLNGF